MPRPMLQSVDQLYVIVGFLPNTAKMNYLTTNSALITNGTELNHALICLCHDDRFLFATLHDNLIQTTVDFMDIFFSICPDMRAMFALAHHHFVASHHLISDIIQFLPFDHGFKFAEEFLKTTSAGPIHQEIFHALHPSHRSQFANQISWTIAGA